MKVGQSPFTGMSSCRELPWVVGVMGREGNRCRGKAKEGPGTPYPSTILPSSCLAICPPPQAGPFQPPRKLYLVVQLHWDSPSGGPSWGLSFLGSSPPPRLTLAHRQHRTAAPRWCILACLFGGATWSPIAQEPVKVRTWRRPRHVEKGG